MRTMMIEIMSMRCFFSKMMLCEHDGNSPISKARFSVRKQVQMLISMNNGERFQTSDELLNRSGACMVVKAVIFRSLGPANQRSQFFQNLTRPTHEPVLGIDLIKSCSMSFKLVVYVCCLGLSTRPGPQAVGGHIFWLKLFWLKT